MRRRIRPSEVIVVSATLASLLLLAPSVPAAHAPAADPGYRGAATASAIHVSAITTQTARTVSVDVGVANAAVDSKGLKQVDSALRRKIVPAGIAKIHARAHSTIAEVGTFLTPPDADAQIKPWVAITDAPGGEKVDKVVVNTSVSQAAFVELLRNTSDARWSPNACPVDGPITTAEQHAARVEVLETGDDAKTPREHGFDKPVAGLDAERGGPRRATTHGTASQTLIDGAGEGLALESLSQTTLAPVTLFQGTASEFTVEIDGPAFLRAVADGTPGGAQVTYRAPLVSVIQGGEVRQVVPSAPVRIRVPDAPDAIAEVSLGVMQPLPGDDETEAKDGTRAAAQANVVLVKLLDFQTQGLEVLTVALGHMEATAEVPPDGIECAQVLGVTIEREPPRPQAAPAALPRTGIPATMVAGSLALALAALGGRALRRVR